MDCPLEKTTQHHLGEHGGFGPVTRGETVLLGVFQSTDFDPASKRVKLGAFKPSRLKKYELSLARRAFTSRSTFQTNVIDPAERRDDPFVGVASASAAAIFGLQFVCSGIRPPVTGRAVCLLDLVAPSDHDGHAALGYSESQERLTENQKKQVRARIHAQLADIFDPVQSLDEIPFDT